MRLTLRNLLRHIDDCARSPREAKQLGKLVQSAGRAEAWRRRIETVVRTHTAPAASTGYPADANRIARFLDGRMNADEESDFEKECFNRDELLAEAASCHAALAALRNRAPAGISLAAREQLYALRSDTALDPQTPDDLPFRDADDKEIPAAHDDQLSGVDGDQELSAEEAATFSGSTRMGRLVVIGLMGLLLVVAASYFAGWVSHKNWVTDSQAQLPSPARQESRDLPVQAWDAAAPQSAPGPPPVVPPANDGATAPSRAAQVAESRDDQSAQGAQSDLPPRPMRSGDLAESDLPPRPDKVPEPTGATVATLVSRAQLLARFDHQTDQWFRHTDGASLREGDRLWCVDGFRPLVEFPESFRLTLVDRAQATIGKKQGDERQQLQLQLGRFVLQPLVPGVACELQFPARTASLILVEPDTRVGIEVQGFVPPGSDYASTPPQHVVNLIVLSGSCIWQSAEVITLAAGDGMALVDQHVPKVGQCQDIPPWLSQLELTAMELPASELEPEISLDRPLEEQLFSLIDDRRAEVRRLAAISLIALQRFDFLLDMFNLRSNRHQWGYLLDALRFELQQNPQAAVLLEQSLRSAGEQAPLLFELLRGYNQQQLAQGAAGQLIERLDDNLLAVRVLALENLRRITGVTLLYRPDVEGRYRREKIRRWQLYLENGQVRYAQEPAPPLIELAEPAAGPAGGKVRVD